MNTSNLPQTDELAAYSPTQLFDHMLIAYRLFKYSIVESHPGLVKHPVTGEVVAPPDYTDDTRLFDQMSDKFEADHTLIRYLCGEVASRAKVVSCIARYLRNQP